MNNEKSAESTCSLTIPVSEAGSSNDPSSGGFTNSSVDLRYWTERRDHRFHTLLQNAINASPQLRHHHGSDYPGTFSSVLIIYVGGTMGMRYDAHTGYVPESGLLCRILSKHPYFSRELYLQSLHVPSPHPQAVVKEDSILHEGADAQVASTDGDGDMVVRVEGNSRTRDQLLDWMYMPPTRHDGRSIRYRILEYPTLLDSSNMGMQDWIRIAEDIRSQYHQYDGFVVIHGTDTLPYTSSALSFMLGSHLGKPVVLTGSQIPFSESRNDASDNLLGAVTIAGLFAIPEVCVCFNHRLLRGNRTVKTSAVDLDSFTSPNLKPLGTFGVSIHVSWDVIRCIPASTNDDDRMNNDDNRGLLLEGVKTKLDPNVAAVRIFPGMTAASLRAFLAAPVRGVILETFGTGNMPTNRPDLLDVVRQAIRERHVVIVNVTQCARGSVDPTLYATGRHLAQLGVVPGFDLTVECALTKLAYLLANFPLESVPALMQTSLVGELTPSPLPNAPSPPLS